MPVVRDLYSKLHKTHEWTSGQLELGESLELEKFQELIAKWKASLPENAVASYVTVRGRSSYGYYDSYDVEIYLDFGYWRPLTEEELAKKAEQTKLRSAAARKANKKKKEKKEREERELLAKLKEKYEKINE
jgi:hypothetical protein